MVEATDPAGEFFGSLNNKMIDLEEKQRIFKDRMFLIGQNLVELKDSTTKKIIELKTEVEIIKQHVERMSAFLENVSEEFSKFAKKEDVEILAKQAKMFQPLLSRKKD